MMNGTITHIKDNDMGEILPNDQPKNRADHLISFMLAMYGDKFKKQYSGHSPRSLAKVWQPILENLSEGQLEKGIETCSTKPWPPTLPEFISFCRTNLDPENAYNEAVQCLIQRQNGLVGDWSHPAIYYAASKMASEILSNGYAAKRKSWEKALNEELSKESWPAIPTPPLQLEAQHTPASSSRQTKEIAALIASALEKKEHDPLAWAKKILANPQGKAIATINKARVAINEAGGRE